MRGFDAAELSPTKVHGYQKELKISYLDQTSRLFDLEGNECNR